jgi:hypothetical protein
LITKEKFMEMIEKTPVQLAPIEPAESPLLELSALQLAIVGGGIGETTL